MADLADLGAALVVGLLGIASVVRRWRIRVSHAAARAAGLSSCPACGQELERRG